METSTNSIGVPEIRHYQRTVIDGAVIVTYEQRNPGEHHWQPVRIVRLT